MSRIKINKEDSWIYASTSKIPQIGVDYWNANDQQEMYGMFESEVSGVSESVSFTLESNEGEDITGVVVVFTDVTTGDTKEFIWNGSPIDVIVPEGHQYKFSCDGSSKSHISGETSTYVAVGSNNREVVLTLVYNLATDLSMYDIYGTAISQTTANCYIIKEAGQYRFPLVYGNAIKNGAINSAAYTKQGTENTMDFVNYNNEKITSPYIETDTGQVVTDVEISMADTDGGLTDLAVVPGTNYKYIQFTATSVPTVGANYVVSAKNSSGTILWSWHIWYWPNDLTVKTLTNPVSSTPVSYDILPVNLATKLDSESALTSTTGWKNWFYQWGRHVPMLPPASYNSTSDHTNYGVKTFTKSSSPATNYGVSIQNPGTFYIYKDASNWFGTASYYNLWDAACTTTGNSDNVVVKTVYDPSPIGFHIPNGNTFIYFSIDTIVNDFSNGYAFKRTEDDNTGVFFPASGFRLGSSGSLRQIGNYGYYWLSSSYTNVYAYFLRFYSGYVDKSDNSYRAHGYSVRCVKEED